MTLKEKFLNAVMDGELGVLSDFGAVVTLADFKQYFKDIETDYVHIIYVCRGACCRSVYCNHILNFCSGVNDV